MKVNEIRNIEIGKDSFLYHGILLLRESVAQFAEFNAVIKEALSIAKEAWKDRAI